MNFPASNQAKLPVRALQRFAIHSLFEQPLVRMSGLQALLSGLSRDVRPPIGDALEFTLIEASATGARFEGIRVRHIYDPMARVHGGYSATKHEKPTAAWAIRV